MLHRRFQLQVHKQDFIFLCTCNWNLRYACDAKWIINSLMELFRTCDYDKNCTDVLR